MYDFHARQEKLVHVPSSLRVHVGGGEGQQHVTLAWSSPGAECEVQ